MLHLSLRGCPEGVEGLRSLTQHPSQELGLGEKFAWWTLTPMRGHEAFSQECFKHLLINEEKMTKDQALLASHLLPRRRRVPSLQTTSWQQ